MAVSYTHLDVYKRQVLWYLVGGILLCLITVLFGFLMGGTGVFIGIVFLAIYLAAVLKYVLQKAAAVRGIAEGVQRIKDGEFGYQITKGGGQEFDEIAAGIEHIAEGFDTAVTREVKSERMKTELICLLYTSGRINSHSVHKETGS